MALTLVRHTRPEVAPGTCYGRTDLDVATSFPDEAAAVLAALPEVKQIVTSPLTRCRKLAEFLAAERGLDAHQDQRLQEMDFGRWEHRSWSDIPRAELDAWAADFLHATPHGGESVAMLRTRTMEALFEWRAAGQPTVIVTHSGVIRAAMSNGDTADDFATSIDFGGAISLPSAKGTRP